MTHQIRNSQSKIGNVEPHHLFSDLSAELLRTGMNICFKASGWSMHPSIKDGETITVEPVAPCDVKRGDIILYLSQRGVIAHRVVKIQSAVKSQQSTTSPQSLALSHQSTSLSPHPSALSPHHSALSPQPSVLSTHSSCVVMRQTPATSRLSLSRF